MPLMIIDPASRRICLPFNPRLQVCMSAHPVTVFIHSTGSNKTPFALQLVHFHRGLSSLVEYFSFPVISMAVILFTVAFRDDSVL